MYNVCFIIIGTKKYFNYGIELIKSMDCFLKGSYDILFLTDKNNLNKFDIKNTLFSEIPIEDWPLPTLKRFHYILDNKKYFDKYSHIFYIDADMKILSPIDIEKEFISDRVVVEHQMMYDLSSEYFTFEDNPHSNAYVTSNMKPNFYYQNNFFGGEKNICLKMCDELSKNIDNDLSNNIIAKWWDESHANKYYITNSPTKVLSLEYNCPEDRIFNNKKIIHLNKNNDEVRK